MATVKSFKARRSSAVLLEGVLCFGVSPKYCCMSSLYPATPTSGDAHNLKLL